MSANLRYILGSLLALGLFCGAAFWFVIDAAEYDKEHPIVCLKEGTIKEILGIEEAYATIKLENEEIVKYKIFHREGGRSYNISLKTKDIICLNYGKK